MSATPALNVEPQNGTSVLSPAQRQFWEENGFLVLPGFFSSDAIDRINALIERIWISDRKDPNCPLVIDTFLDTPRQERIKLHKALPEVREYPYKLNDLFLTYPDVRNMILDEMLSRMLGELLDGEPMVCNSLSFERGSQQGMHVDTFFMPPPVKNKMVATWISLEDVHEDSGPLFYFPGSHKIEQFVFSNGTVRVVPAELPNFNAYMDTELKKRGIDSKIFCAKKGDVFIWHAHLLHGGSPIKDLRRTRKSLVTHYFRSIDFDASVVRTVAPGRHYLDRSHQAVDMEMKMDLQIAAYERSRRFLQKAFSKVRGLLANK